jgi:TRAP-type C4-dicarboxylate transport system permease small subunit
MGGARAPPALPVSPVPASRLRRALDALYAASGALAAVALAGTCVVMLLQVAGRELGLLFRGADDITAWLCAAAAFLALGHTFRKGELVRMTLAIDRLPPRARWLAEVLSLSVAALVGGYMVYAVTRFVYESWKFNEVAQGLIKVPIWIPQIGFAVGVAIFFVAIVDELVAVLRRQTPAYQLAEDERRARGDFSETV